MSPSKRQPSNGEARGRTAWGAQVFAQMVRSFPASTPPAERRLVRCVYTVFDMSDRMLDHMQDAEVWELALAVEQLKATAAHAIESDVDGCYVRTVVGLAFLAARDVLETAMGFLDQDELLRAEVDRRPETP